MSYIAAEDVAKAKEMDLLTFLRNYEPQELVHVSVDTYCTREHDSLRISNGKWCWFSQGIGGRSALDYLIKVKGYSFIQEVKTILGRAAEKPPIFYCPRGTKNHRAPDAKAVQDNRHSRAISDESRCPSRYYSALHRQDRCCGRNDAVELYWGTHLQHAHPGRLCEDVRPDCTGDDGAVMAQTVSII